MRVVRQAISAATGRESAAVLRGEVQNGVLVGTAPFGGEGSRCGDPEHG